MGNYHTQFSITLERVNEEEASWLRERLKEMEQEEDGRTFRSTLEGTSLWLRSTERLDDQLLAFLQAFFKEKRPNEYLLIDYACTADHPYVDAYGGGTIFVSAYTISWSNHDAWKNACLQELAGQVKGPIREADTTG